MVRFIFIECPIFNKYKEPNALAVGLHFLSRNLKIVGLSPAKLQNGVVRIIGT